MPVTFKVNDHKAEPVRSGSSAAPQKRSPESLLQASWGSATKPTAKCSELLQSTFGQPRSYDNTSIDARKNGFVNTLVQAYNKHHHLTIRPDDVWIAILSQFSFYVNAHAEELRSHFVAHEGKKVLTVTAAGSRYSVDFGSLAVQMTDLIHREVVDPELKDWILPKFTTTTQNDTITASVVMMATLKAYFSYGCMLVCGLPSVTLEGEKEDWENILSRIDKLSSFGEEPAQWAVYLRPILRRFVAAFDGNPDLDFWNNICHYRSMGSGPTYLTGWITAFCVWKADGTWMGGNNTKGRMTTVLDDANYPVLESDQVPAGFAEVDVKLNDNGQEFDCVMVAGHVASEVIGPKGDGLCPRPGWFFFIKGELDPKGTGTPGFDSDDWE